MQQYKDSRCFAWIGGFALFVSGVLLSCASSFAQSLTWLPGPPELDPRSLAYSVSADGRVVVGVSRHAQGFLRAVRWVNGVGQSLAPVPGYNNSVAQSVSADGRTIVGYGYQNIADTPRQAVIWTQDTLHLLETLPDFPFSEARDVSADGQIVVGSLRNEFTERAVVWRNRTVQNLGVLAGFQWSFANGVSANGQFIVGSSGRSFPEPMGRQNAVRWRDGSLVSLDGLPGIDLHWGQAISNDGAVVVGFVTAPGYPRAVRWRNGVPELLSQILSELFDISADGRVAVGRADFGGGYRAVRLQGNQLEDLNVVCASLLTPGSVLRAAYGVSLDGRYIVGSGFNAVRQRGEAFLLDTWRRGDTDGDGCIDDADLLRVLFAFGGQGTGYTRQEDINRDGIVDDADLLIVLFEFGSGCP
ncbi:MAG: hypothetical protein NZ843_03865 [Fimbriimonadales bacterium]|nr:hypothetical protein [Fimbriimonadales bacterium]